MAASKKDTATAVNLARFKATCRECNLRERCLPLGLNESERAALEDIIRSRRALKKGETLYRFGDPLRSLYAIHSGSLKSTCLIGDGRAQVTGFHLPGELLGADAISAEVYPCSAQALEGSEVCEIPYDKLKTLAQHIPGLQHQLFRMMSREIVADERLVIMLGRMSAEERLAACLMNFSQRYAYLGMDGTVLRLTMSRQDLGEYLGLALETVSRLFSRFQNDGLIEVHGRCVHLLDRQRLDALASGGTKTYHRLRACGRQGEAPVSA